MVVYRRNFVAGGTYFFTVTLRDRRARFLVDYVDEFHAAFAQSRARKPFVIEAMVVLPDHLHTIWRLPDHDTDYPGRWKSIKSLFTQSLARNGLDVGKRRGQRIHLATALLGAYHSRRTGLATSYRLHSLQSGETRLGTSGSGLAVFIISPLCSARDIALGLGWRRN